jgi:2-oxoglutarate dehydrogenase E2 component (dihydrolipoamide succinyltransferase)
MVDVVMPQMGESIAEGTVIKWIKKVGDKVERDEPLVEISTDKVDAEIPAPASGTLSEILAQEGQTVPVNSVVARLAAEGEAAQPSSAPPAAQPEASAATASAVQPESTGTVAAPRASGEEDAGLPQTPAPAVGGQVASNRAEGENVTSLEERRRTKSSPLVRKIAKENDVDIAAIEGSGVSGRVTKKDILEYLEAPKPAAAPAARTSHAPSAREPQAPSQTYTAADRIEPMSVMRRRISDHMVISKRTSAHVTTAFEFDFTNIDKLRRKYKDSYAERGAKLTYLPFIAQAIATAIREFPILNSSVDGDNIIYRGDINLGIAVALDWGLIVPVVKRADEKNILGLSKAIADLGERARTKKLNPDDVQGGTFTITNPGIYGGLWGTPIINQPQVAILGVGGVKKRPVVIESEAGDSIAIRSMCIMTLSFDHRIIDGAVADQFMARVRQIIETAKYAL